jgi:hypothetical protein
VFSLGHGAQQHFTDQEAAFRDFCLKCGVFWRVDDINPASDHCGRAGVQRRLMRRGINAARQTGDNTLMCLTQFRRNLPREFPPDG